MAQILVVDDDAAVRGAIEAVLGTGDHDVRLAADGLEAMDAIMERLPDLILLDLAMPVMSGWHVLDELHTRGLRARTRVILMSGQMEPSEVAARAPSDHFLPKPFDLDQLLQCVDHVLSSDPRDLYVRRERTGDLARLLRDVDQVLG